MKPFNQEDAWAIQKKLEAEVDSSARRHVLVKFRHNGAIVVQFGIRRGSGELGHGYLPKEMKLSQKECREFRICNLSVDQYLQILKSKGFLD